MSRVQVIRRDDDGDVPQVGDVITTDGDIAWVTWGDLRFTDTAAEFAAREHADDLIAYPTRP